MASMVGKLLFSCAVFFFFLSFIFVIIGYSTFWLVPREDTIGGVANRVDGVGLKQACFTDFRFPFQVDMTDFVTCYDNTRNSAKFYTIDEDAWSPRWFQTIQDMHLTCIILMIFNLLLLGGFVAIYFTVVYYKRKGKRIPPCLVLTKCGLALWFIISYVISFLLLAEPIMFYVNYSSNTSTFYYSDKHTFDYGEGFGITIGAGISMLICAGLGSALFCGLILNVLRKTLNPMRDDDYYSQDGSQYSASEADNLSMSEERRVRKDPDGGDDSEVIENYKREPPTPTRRKSIASMHRYDDTDDASPDGKSPDGRPIPAPRRSTLSPDTSMEMSVVSPGHDRTPHYADSDVERAPSHYSGSHAPSVRSVRPQQFQYDFKPGQGYVPKTSARPASDVDSQYSSANQRASLSPHGGPPPGGRLYVPPSRTSYAGSIAGYSDAESYQSDRNRSVIRSAARQPSEPPQSTQTQKVVNPKTSKDAKHSRYAAAGW